MELSASIFLDSSKRILRASLQEGQRDIVRLYRADSFWSKTLIISRSKLYSYKLNGGESIINGRDKEGFKSLYVDSFRDDILDAFKDNSPLYMNYIGNHTIGYEVVEKKIIDKTNDEYSVNSISSVDMFYITVGIDGTVEIEDAIIKIRNKNIDKILNEN